MPKSSTAYVTCDIGGKTYTYHFTGVTAIEHTRKEKGTRGLYLLFRVRPEQRGCPRRS